MLWKNGQCFCGTASVERRLQKSRQYDSAWAQGHKPVEPQANRNETKMPKHSAFIGQLGTNGRLRVI